MLWILPILYYQVGCCKSLDLNSTGFLSLAFKIESADGSLIRGYENIRIDFDCIQVMHKKDFHTSSIEQQLFISEESRTLFLATSIHPIHIGTFKVPPGYIEEIRLCLSRQITPPLTLAISGDLIPVTVEENQGYLAITPADNFPFEVVKNKVTEIIVSFDPQRQFKPSRSERFLFKPNIKEAFTVISKTKDGFKPHVIVVRFYSNIPREKVIAINLEIGARIINTIPELNEYKIRIPNNLSPEKALRFYESKKEVEIASRPFLIGPE